ncbi:MAG: kelch repeat-containing protein, partial [Thermoproteota archaeon]|nr:kelch repeat-containing protein [Thermoproteota archaeon]
MSISNISGGTAILLMMFTFCVLYFSSAQTSLSSSTTSESFWTTAAPMPTARSEIAGTILDGKVYVIGGFDGSGRSTTITEVYDPMTNQWTTAAPLPQPLDHTAAASFEGKLYVVG